MMIGAGAAQADPRFTTITAPPHIYSGGWERFVGGGLAAFDCDGDHLPELFAAGGEAPASLFLNISARGGPVAFAEATPEGLDLTGVIGAYPLDIDSDGVLDLAVLRFGRNLLLKGGPDCSFKAFDRIGFRSPEKWSTAFSATWEAGQHLPTLAFGNYVDRANADGPFRACDTNTLYRPDGATYRAPDMLAPGYCALSMLFSDWGKQNQIDLRVGNDRHYYVDDGQEQLWTMSHPPRLYSEQDGWTPIRLWGMGIASRNIDRDGVPEVFLSSMGDQRLQALVNGKTGPTYQDVPFETGRPHTAPTPAAMAALLPDGTSVSAMLRTMAVMMFSSPKVMSSRCLTVP